MARKKYLFFGSEVQKDVIVSDASAPTNLDSEDYRENMKGEFSSVSWLGEWMKKSVAFKPEENYTENEELYYSVPTLTMSVDAKNEILASKGYEIADQADDVVSNEEKDVENLFSNILNINSVSMVNIGCSLDLKGNSTHWIKWEEDIPVKATFVPFEFMRPGIEDGCHNHWRYSICKRFDKKSDDPRKGYVKLELWEVVHITEKGRAGSPIGISKVQPIRQTLKNRRDMNLILPVIAKRYAKPFISWSIDTNHPRVKTPGKVRKIRTYIYNMLKTMEPDSDVIHPDYVKPTPLTTNVAYPKEHLQDLDRTIIGAIGTPESIWFAEGSTDQKTQIQENLFLTKVGNRQQIISDAFWDQLIKLYMDRKYPSSKVEPRMIWPELKLEDIFKTVDAVIKASDAGLLEDSEARKLLPWDLDDRDVIIDKDGIKAESAAQKKAEGDKSPELKEKSKEVEKAAKTGTKKV